MALSRSDEPAPAGGDGHWDPEWPSEPDERIGLQDVYPNPVGAPVDARDEAGWAFDGGELWPADWPGRWITDPAVAAAGGALPGDSPGQPATGAPCGSGQGRPAGAVPPPRRGVVDLQVPLTTLLRLAEMPGELSGWGPVVADIARQIACRQRDGTWRFSIYDELGELAFHGITRTRPAAAIGAFVRARDGTCMAPGCRRPASGCDLDHTVDKSKGGHCGPSNMGSLCRMHHRFKHTGGAHLAQLSPGVFCWTTPRRLQYVTHPDRPLVDDGELVDPCLPESTDDVEQLLPLSG